MASPTSSRVGLVLKPGQRGTKKLSKIHGESLLCVRYRYDEETNKRYKTVELIIESKDWHPEEHTRERMQVKAKPAQEALNPLWENQHLVTVAVPATRKDIQTQLQNIGATPQSSNPELWQIPFEEAIRLRLRKFIQTKSATLNLKPKTKEKETPPKAKASTKLVHDTPQAQYDGDLFSQRIS